MSANRRSWPPFSRVDDVISHTSVSKPTDDHPETLALIGQVIEAWSYLESRLRNALAVLLDDNNDAAHAVYYSVYSLKGRIDIIEAIAKYVLPYGDERDGFFTLLNKTRRLSKFRNDLVHGEIHSGEKKPLALIVNNPRNPDKFDHADLDLSEIRNHISAVYRLEEQFNMALVDDTTWYVRLWSSR